MADSPYPELKKTHTAPRTGTPWRDRKPAPAAPVWGIIQGLGAYWTLAAAVELGLFDRIGPGRRVSADDVAQALDASPPHVRSVLDSLVAMGLLELVGGRYGLNETAERYLTTAGAASMVDLVAVAPGPLANWIGLADTVRHGRVATPIEDDPAAFYRPLVTATFPTQRRVAMFTARAIGFARWPGTPRVLDLGAGAGAWTVGLLEAHPGATAVVNDLADVIDLAAAQLAELGLAERCELRAGDFHAIAVEDGGYDVAVLGHVTRTEGVDGARHVIGRAHDALRPGGRLLLADYFADPEPTRNPFGALMGTTMVANTRHGSTFTNEQYVEWLREAGFEAVRLLEPIGFQFVYVATRPR